MISNNSVLKISVCFLVLALSVQSFAATTQAGFQPKSRVEAKVEAKVEQEETIEAQEDQIPDAYSALIGGVLVTVVIVLSVAVIKQRIHAANAESVRSGLRSTR